MSDFVAPAEVPPANYVCTASEGWCTPAEPPTDYVFISDEFLHMKQVVNTNKCLIHLHKHNVKLLITSVIDNLLKGASGQAVQNMNLMFGLEETTGLGLKATYF